jgi:hypothetical protein
LQGLALAMDLALLQFIDATTGAHGTIVANPVEPRPAEAI